MNAQSAVDILRQAFLTAFWLAFPILAVGFVAGIVVSFVQILTSIQDPAFGSVPRLAAFLAALFLFLPWMLLKLCTYTLSVFGDLARYAR